MLAMKKISLLLITMWLAFSSAASAQNNLLHECGTTHMVEQSLQQHEHARRNMAALKKFTAQYEAQHRTQSGSNYVIPVVVHIIHNYGNSNISYAQVEDAIRILNEDFNKRNSDTSLIIPDFVPIIGDASIEFRLAKLDPLGNCTQGVTRTFSPLTSTAGENVKQLVSWNTSKYFNIWVVSSIASGAGGYAYYPGSAPSPSQEGVVVRSAQFGSIGTSGGSNFASRTMTHEAGHYLNLPHPWGSTNSPGSLSNCNIDDGVSDTPLTAGVNGQGCPLTQFTCGSLDNVQNYMDYSSCGRMFTQGQGLRMEAALNSSFGSRNTLWTPANLIATGTNDGYTAGFCTPIADFSPRQFQVCQGDSVLFRSATWNIEGDSTVQYTWLLDGVQVDTGETPYITFLTAGSHIVRLVATNATGSDFTETTVQVRQTNIALTVPFKESMETMGFPTGTGWETSADGSASWELVSTAGSDGTNAMRTRNWQTSLGYKFRLTSPAIQVNNLPLNKSMLYFDYAYPANFTAGVSQETFRVQVSIDCGKNWTDRYTKKGDNLATTTQLGSFNYLPMANHWKTDSINLLFYVFIADQILVRFEVESDRRQNFFLDNIRMGDNYVTGFNNELATVSAPQAFITPNPSEGEAFLTIKGVNQVTNITVTDAAGKQVIPPFELQPNTTEQQVALRSQTGMLAPGMYFVKIQSPQSVPIILRWVKN